MTDIEKIFEQELNSFEDKSILDFTKAVLRTLPKYFFEANPDGRENRVILMTKTAMRFANALFGLSLYRNRFLCSERDSMRAAIMLHDGLIYGNGQNKNADPNHPYTMAEYIRGFKYELPMFIKEDIANMVLAHSGQDDEKLKTPDTEMEEFVFSCCFLSSKNDTTINLPITSVILNQNLSRSMAWQMINGKSWNNYIYCQSNGNPYIFLDGYPVNIPKELVSAFYALSSERTGTLLSKKEFDEKYHENINIVADEYENLSFTYEGKKIPLSYEQCLILGIQIPLSPNKFLFMNPDWDFTFHKEKDGNLYFYSRGKKFPVFESQFKVLSEAYNVKIS